jgi:hypothetical protein
METPYLLMLSALTSVAALTLGQRAFGLGTQHLGTALRRALETLGAAFLFWTANVALGVALALVVRTLGLGFVSVYVSTDVSLGALSLLQALVFEAWREQGRRTPAPPRA